MTFFLEPTARLVLRAASARTLAPSERFSQANGGTRTHDLCFTKALLYQLSYAGARRLGKNDQMLIEHA